MSTESIVFWAGGGRGAPCLRALLDRGETIRLVVTSRVEHPACELAARRGIETAVADDPGAPGLVPRLRTLGADLFVLAGYGGILPPDVLSLPRLGAINLHGGRLPEYRGSSPLNWALINGEPTFGLSVIQVDSGIDSGDVLAERTFPIGPDDTIADLHRLANEQFPAMLRDVLAELRAGTLEPRPQDEARAAYYPRRFPADGLVVFDQLSAEQVHNRVRALTEPYPCAFTFLGSRRMRLLRTRLRRRDHFGEPGRVYRVVDQGLLVGAADRCLWITDAVWDESGEPVLGDVRRYDELATMRRCVQAWHESMTCVSEISTPTGAS
ncbi:MAG: methionyl-tRNA formyltransferase [Planctomycetota bacterium]|jgi:methionyl-tRNA formyltransferase